MKLPQILAALTSEPQLIESGRAASLLNLFQKHATLSAAEFAAQRQGKDMCGSPVLLESMTVEKGIAWIPILGPIGMGFGPFEKGAGCVDVSDIIRDLEEAEEDDRVENIVLVFDSPGGMVSGTPETGDRIAAVQKPIYAWTEGGLIASAAYWLACACDGIFATKSADIGSIGVYAPFIDSSKAMEMEGLKVKLFTSGDFKGMGYPGTSLTPQQEEFMQNRTLEIAGMFYDYVIENRPDVDTDAMQGQAFKAETALKQGLIDAVMADRDELISFLS